MEKRGGQEGSKEYSGVWEERSERSHSRVSPTPMGWAAMADGTDTQEVGGTRAESMQRTESWEHLVLRLAMYRGLCFTSCFYSCIYILAAKNVSRDKEARTFPIFPFFFFFNIKG